MAPSVAAKAKEAGNGCFVRKQFAEAVQWYSRAIAASPEEAALYTNRAAASSELGQARRRRWEAALQDAQHSVALDRGWAKGHYRAGLALLQLGRAADALAAFQAGGEAEPLNAQMQSGLAQAQAALAEVPADAADARARGNACYREGQYDQAAEWYTKALVLCSPGEGDAQVAALYANRAECHRQLGSPCEVVRDCSAALLLQPGHAKALRRRALALEALERFSGAAEDYEALEALGGEGAPAARQGARRCRTQAKEAAASAAARAAPRG